MEKSSAKNLIFDLGGVILDLSVDHTLQAFADLSAKTKEEVTESFLYNPGFLDYEKGIMSDSEFRTFIRQLFLIQATDDQIDACWNAMLGGIPVEKISLLKRLKKYYNVYLLSNTNGIHLDYIDKQIMPHLPNGISLDAYFHKAYYSHRMGMRKPDLEIFETVLKENNLLPGHTLFLDDNKNNIEGARLVGIQTLHVVTPNLILEYFHE